MLQSLSAALAEISLPQLALMAGMALIASIIGGVAGYGTGALMPLVLVPIVGAEPVVPILSLSALLTNTGRATAFWSLVDGRRAVIVLLAAVPTCVLGAWAYTMLTGKGAALVIGAVLVRDAARLQAASGSLSRRRPPTAGRPGGNPDGGVPQFRPERGPRRGFPHRLRPSSG